MQTTNTAFIIDRNEINRRRVLFLCYFIAVLGFIPQSLCVYYVPEEMLAYIIYFLVTFFTIYITVSCINDDYNRYESTYRHKREKSSKLSLPETLDKLGPISTMLFKFTWISRIDNAPLNMVRLATLLFVSLLSGPYYCGLLLMWFIRRIGLISIAKI